jgi:hypothetical protein
VFVESQHFANSSKKRKKPRISPERSWAKP